VRFLQWGRESDLSLSATQSEGADLLNVGGRALSLNEEEQSMKFRMGLGKDLKFESTLGSRQVSLKKAVKERITMKLGRWCEEEMEEYVEFIREYDFMRSQISLRDERCEADALPF